MAETNWITLAGDVVAAIGRPSFPASLTRMLRAITPYTYTVIFGYSGAARPLDLYDDFPSGKRKIFVTDYQEGPYLLDPFYLAALRPIAPGLHRMSDLAPDRFYQGEYFRNYYAQTGLVEEIGFFIDLPGGAMVVLSLMRDQRAFSNRAFESLSSIWPILSAAARLHWADLSRRLGSAEGSAVETRLQLQIDQSFQTFGGGVLTPREREIVEYTLKGHSAEATGRILGISPGTVRIHRRNIYAKLRISSQGELFSKFIETLRGGI